MDDHCTKADLQWGVNKVDCHGWGHVFPAYRFPTKSNPTTGSSHWYAQGSSFSEQQQLLFGSVG